ncbi:MAG: right-handed parallel beta-helix repeat-containing protein [Eubacteriales bacterium]|nr:right-handed parallel beta-helix repeat-containing protein [Eubacteriales bacterium]
MTTLTLAAGALTQSIFDKVGDGLRYDTVEFSPGSYPVNTPLKLNSGTALKKSPENGEATIKLTPVSTSAFPEMRPVFGQKRSSISDIEIAGLTFDGNYGNQRVSLGKGFHNFVGLSTAQNITIHDCYIHDSAGDGARLTNVKNVKWYNNRVCRCGHDALYIDKGSDIEVFKNYVELRTNSGCRFRHVINGHAHHNKIINKVGGKASSPGMQIENSTSGMTSKNILIENNEIFDTWGPSIWVIGTSNTAVSAASGLTIRGNTFSNCGNMDSDYHHIPGVGGIVMEGFDQVMIENNTFKNNKGYGVLFGEYVRAYASGSGYSAIVKNNTFTGTRKANTVGVASGTALANVKPTRYTSVIAQGNKYSGNVRDLYNVVEITVVPEKNVILEFDCDENELNDVLKLKTKYPGMDIMKRL